MTLLEEAVYEAERFVKVAKQKPPKYSTIRRASQDLSQKLVDLRKAPLFDWENKS